MFPLYHIYLQDGSRDKRSNPRRDSCFFEAFKVAEKEGSICYTNFTIWFVMSTVKLDGNGRIKKKQYILAFTKILCAINDKIIFSCD